MSHPRLCRGLPPVLLIAGVSPKLLAHEDAKKLLSSVNLKGSGSGYRDFARKYLVGSVKIPRIRGIEQKGRIVAFYSREDLSTGMVGEPVDGIYGYDPDTATAIMRNLILYSAFGGNKGAH